MHTYFLKNLLLFGRLLRLMGMDVGPAEMIELTQALDVVDLGKKWDVYHAARSVLVRRHEDYPLFDQAWRVFWRKAGNPNVPRLELQADPRLMPKPLRVPLRPHDASDGQGRHEEETVSVHLQQSFSANELLRRKDFGAFTWEEVQEAKRMMQQMVWRVGERRTRRRRPVRGGEYLDLRRVVRSNLRYGGEFLSLAWKRRKTKPRPLIILCDISGSMEQYSRMLLHFIHTISAGFDFDKVEAFLFSTRLTRITRPLAHRDVDDALDAVERQVQDWSGGTRIGEAIHNFNYHWARRVLGRGAVVMIISDGWDRGEPRALAVEMERLQKSCHRLIWLNPLIGSEGYQPMTQGLLAALPYVDDFLSVRNLNSLAELGRQLSTLDERQPVRRRGNAPGPARPAAKPPAAVDERFESEQRAQARRMLAERLRGIVH
jgi:uncharacterized protein with von Willebrand factor type A (vWA) domain